MSSNASIPAHDTPPQGVLHLPDDLPTCHQMLRELLETVAQLRATIERQQTQIDYLLRRTFGRRSERVEGPTLFDGLLDPEPEPPAAPPPEPVEEVVVKKGGSSRRRKSREDLPRRHEVLDLTEAEKLCPCCGEARVRIGADVSERIDYVPSSIFVHAIERPTYICRRCEQRGEDIQAAQAPLPPTPIPRCTVAAGLLAHVIVSKWIDHLPLYRLEGILARMGWQVARSTLCDQMMACANLLTPLYELMCQRVRASYALHTDDSPVRLLNPLRTAYAWIYLGDRFNPYTVFELSPGHQQEFPQQFLGDYRGFIHADGYSGYNPLYAAGATHVGCWMHVRRYFFEAKDSDPARAHEAIARIRLLYAVEREAKEKGLLDAELAAYRQEHAGPLLQGFADWLAKEVPRSLPKSKMGEALTYATNQWPSLIRYVADGWLAIDNSAAEQAIRPLAVGRRNWLQIAGDGGLKSAGVLLSMAATVKRHGVNAWEYLEHVLGTMAQRGANADYSDLLVDTWQQARADSAPAKS